MKYLWLAILCLSLTPFTAAQAADDMPSRDDVMAYLQIMRTHDMIQKMAQVQAQSTEQLLKSAFLKNNTKLPADFDSRFRKSMEDLIKNMPIDDMTQAMIPVYQKHFTKGDLEAMTAFYSSPVGQKVLQELPAVMQEGNQSMMPILSKYIGEWMVRMQQEFKPKKTVVLSDQD